MGVVRTPLWAQRYYRFEPGADGGNPWSATLLGVAFGFGWTPCIGPVLGSILVLSATSESVGHGTVLLGVYALGLGVPFLLSAFFMTDRKSTRLNSSHSCAPRMPSSPRK